MKNSILLITYNHSKYIRQALSSILMQRNCDEFEIIVCDDCSTDNTFSIVETTLSGKKNAFFYRNEQNIGITKNYQQAFSKCSGEYIFILEGDDYWTDPLKVKKVGDFFDQHPNISVCAHTFHSLKEETGELTPPLNHKEEYYSSFESKELILDPGIISNFSSCSYRKSALNKIPPGLFEMPSYEWIINIAAGQSGAMARINEPMSVYRLSQSGAWSSKKQDQQLKDLIGVIDDYNGILDLKFNAFFRRKKALLIEELNLIQSERASNPSPALLKRIMRFVAGRQ